MEHKVTVDNVFVCVVRVHKSSPLTSFDVVGCVALNRLSFNCVALVNM